MSQPELFAAEKSYAEKMINNSTMFYNVHRLFHKELKIQFHYYMDFDLSIAFGKPMLDIKKFDEWLHEKHGNYEEQGMSMQDILTENYGYSTMIAVKGLL